MNRIKHFKLLSILKEELEKQWSSHLNKHQWLRWMELLKNLETFFPDHKFYFSGLIESYSVWEDGGYDYEDVVRIIKYIETLDGVHIETETSKERKFLQDAKDKLKEAGISFDNEDYPSAINALNTSIELALKDELDIPTTIRKINTSGVLKICIAEKIGPVEYLKELKPHVLELSNKIKHNGYVPNRADCITAIGAVENLFKKTKKYPFVLTENSRKKIFGGL